MSLQPGTTQLRTFTRSLLTDGTRTVTTFTEAIWAVATRAPGGGRTTTTIRILVSPSTTSRNIGNGRSSSSTPALTSSSSSSSSTSLTTSASGASNTASSTLQSSHHGFTSGAVAGAAVGCLIAGALIAFLLAFFLFRRKQRKHEASVAAANNYDAYHAPDRKTPLAPVPVALGEKSAATGGTAATGIAAPPASPSWLAYLPPSASDHTIATAVKTFYDQIEQHVDTFYSHSPTSDSSSGAQDAQQSRQPLSEIDSGKLPGRIEDLMQESAMVLPVIKHSIADLLITRLSPLAFAETSLLPPHLAEFPQRLQESPASSPAEAAGAFQFSFLRTLSLNVHTNCFPSFSIPTSILPMAPPNGIPVPLARINKCLRRRPRRQNSRYLLPARLSLRSLATRTASEANKSEQQRRQRQQHR